MWKPCCIGIAVLLSVETVAAGTNPPGAGDLSHRLDECVLSAIKRQQVPAVSIGVVAKNHLVFAKGYGVANVELNARASEQSIYQIGSITKQFTATAILMLVEEKKLRLGDQIGDYLKQVPVSWKSITIQDLLTHTSGITNYVSLPQFPNLALHPGTPEDPLKLVDRLLLRFPPGDRWEYSNTGYYLLGLIIEKVSGEKYDAFLQHRIFAPLQMTSTRVNDLGLVMKNRATGYALENNELRNAPRWDPSWAGAAGAPVSNALDLAGTL